MDKKIGNTDIQYMYVCTQKERQIDFIKCPQNRNNLWNANISFPMKRDHLMMDTKMKMEYMIIYLSIFPLIWD